MSPVHDTVYDPKLDEGSSSLGCSALSFQLSAVSGQRSANAKSASGWMRESTIRRPSRIKRPIVWRWALI